VNDRAPDERLLPRLDRWHLIMPMDFAPMGEAAWQTPQSLSPRKFMCGYCGALVSSVLGYALHVRATKTQQSGLYICPGCKGPTFFAASGTRHPTAALGNPVQHLPADIEQAYEEARRCTSAGSYTGAVLLCRKMLMHIAVHRGADEGLPFIRYVEFLCEKGYAPPGSKEWVDHIRAKGNEATHELVTMAEGDAKLLLSFVEMLLRFSYEFAALLPKPPPTP